eukprot:1494843-Rhodomonas_salina.1
MADPQFYSHLSPFHDPSCLVNTQTLTDAEVVLMHEEDGALEVAESDDEELPVTTFPDPSQLSQQPTQQLPLGQHSQSLDQPTTPCLLHSAVRKQPLPASTPPPGAGVSPVPSRPTRGLAHGPGAASLEDIPIQQLSDLKLARALVDNKVVLELPST